MSVSRHLARRVLGALVLVSPTAASGARDDVHLVVPLSALEITEGEFPDSRTAPWTIRWGSGREQLLGPHVALDGPGEAFVLDLRSEKEWAIRLAARVPRGEDVTGRLVVPSLGAETPIDVRFRVEPTDDDPEAWRELVKRRAERRWAEGLPGGAWFRARAAYRGGYERTTSALVGTFDPFRSTRAVSTTLVPRHFRRLASIDERTTSTLPSPAESALHAWSQPRAAAPLVEDPLLRVLPHDQPAIVFPGLAEALAVLEEADRIGTPLLRLVEGVSIETHVREVYEAQLRLPTRRLVEDLAPDAVRSVAVTGSDTSLREGADVAVLFEMDDPAVLLEWMRARHREAGFGRDDATATSGARDGVDWFTIHTPDRAVDSTVLAAGDVVVVTNSPVQVEAFVEVHAGRRPSLAERPEVARLRARYPRGAADESAFLVVSDPTFRRWLGPAWRVKTSRRVRAAAAMGNAAVRSMMPERAGVADDDAAHGRLGFLTPTTEIEVDEITNRELLNVRHAVRVAAADWKTVPVIGARLSVADGGFDVDASMATLHLVPGLEDAREMVGRGRIAPFAGDSHAGTVLHAVQAIDFDGPRRDDVSGDLGAALRELTLRFHPIGFFHLLFFGLVVNALPLEWVGDVVSVSLDADPIWAELGRTDDLWEMLEREFSRFPIAVTFEVEGDAAAGRFLADSRELCRKFLAASFEWDVVESGGRPYHRIVETPRNRDARLVPDDWSPLSICIVHVPGRLVLTVDEFVARRTIGRAAADAPPDVPPWPGESLAARIDRAALEAIEAGAGVWFEEDRQTASWKNLPILNEWRRVFPDEDPVAVHRRLLGREPVCPGGGTYLWNPALGTMESTAYGSPLAPRSEPRMPSLIESVDALSVGVTFEEDALRARLSLRWR